MSGFLTVTHADSNQDLLIAVAYIESVRAHSTGRASIRTTSGEVIPVRERYESLIDELTAVRLQDR